MSITPSPENPLIISGSMQEWIDVVPAYQRTVIYELLENQEPTEAAITWLTSTGPADTAPYGGVRVAAELFYDNLLTELRKLLCGESGYEEERKQLTTLVASGRVALVSFVSVTLAPHVGIAVVVILPAVAIILALVAKAGHTTACQGIDAHIESRRASAKMD